MKFYFCNPITLILAYSEFGSKIKSAVFVENYFRNMEYKQFQLQNKFQRQYATKICERLQIQFQYIDSEQFVSLQTEPDLLEVNLASKKKFKNDPELIFQSSDVYTAFGKNRQIHYLLTRIKLQKLYQNGLKDHTKSNFYVFSESRIKNKKYKIKNLDRVKFVKIANEIGTSLDLEIYSNFIKIASKKILLLLPPIAETADKTFYNNFMSKAQEIAIEKGLEILIKPHRNDTTNYNNESINIKYISIKNINYYPVELLFNLNCIKLVISGPSSSLIFADKTKLMVYVPSDRSNYRKYYLNQENFLRYTNIKKEFL